LVSLLLITDEEEFARFLFVMIIDMQLEILGRGAVISKDLKIINLAIIKNYNINIMSL
jgi:hypothetical protein